MTYFSFINFIMSIVIVGANFAGTIAIDTVFKEAAASANKGKYTVTVISDSSRIYFNPATPRLLVESDKIEKAFFPIEPYLKKHSRGVKYNFVHGRLDHANFDTKTLDVSTKGGQKVVNYDHLILATGSHYSSPVFKLNGDHTKTIDAIKDLYETIKRSKTIAIVGGGATGVETAGEVASVYPDKKVTLFTGSSGPLAAINKEKAATSKLRNLGIEIVNKVKFVSVDTNDDKSTTITLDDGSAKTFDVYIPSYGNSANSSYVDDEYLDEQGWILVDANLRVKGQPDVIAFGDIASISDRTIVDIKMSQTKPFVQTVKKNIFKRDVKLTPHARTKTTQLVPISKSGGIGVIFGYSVPNFLVRQLKSKDFMLGTASKDFS